MASLHHHPGSPYWVAHYTAGGKRTSRSTRIPATEANRARAQSLADLWDETAKRAAAGQDAREHALAALNEIFAHASMPTIPVASWRDITERFLAERRRLKVKPRMMANYEWSLAEFAKFLGSKADRDARHVTLADVERWVDATLKEVTPATVAIRLSHIRAAANYGVKKGILATSPAAGVTLPMVQHATRDVFTPDDIGRLLGQLQAHEEHTQRGRDLRTLVMLGLCTGARLGDCATMTASAIDLDAGTVTFVPQKKSRKGQAVRIALANPLRAHLEPFLHTLAPDAPLCPTLANFRPGTLSNVFKRLLDRAGIAGSTIAEGRTRKFNGKSFHSFRHTLASWLANAGVDDLVRRRITDHEDRKVAAIYQHVSIEATGRALDTVFSGPAAKALK